MNRVRIFAPRLLVLLVFFHAVTFVCGGLFADEVLDELLAEYRSHGLPFPPQDAKLVLREREDGTSNDERLFHRELAFRVPTRKKQKQATYWLGCETETLESTRPDTDAEPVAATVAKTRAAETDYRWNGFTTIPDLALAIQCQARGWNELADALLERSRESLGAVRYDRRPRRPRDDRRAVATLAWNYWCNQFAKAKGDRTEIVEHLRQLLDEDYGLFNKANRNIVTDMEETLEKRAVKPGSLEAAIEGLKHLTVQGGWPGPGDQHRNNSAELNKHFQKLHDAGMDAVPTLIKHLQDDRLTRCMETDSHGRYTWHIRIADVVAVLLNDRNPERFAYDFRKTQGRGVMLDEAHVLHWWAETQRPQALDYLLKNAITADWQGTLRANAAVLRALGQHDPEQLVKLFEERIEQVEASRGFFEALASSRAPDEQKFRLLLAAAKSTDSWKREYALRYLLPMKHPEAVPLLVRELENLPRTSEAESSITAASRFARLVNSTDDDRAWEAFEQNAKRVDIGQRLEMIQGIATANERRRDKVIATLAKFLDDEEVRSLPPDPPVVGRESPVLAFERRMKNLLTGPRAGSNFSRLVVRDFAALQIAYELDLAVDEDSQWTEEDWTKLRKRVRFALAKRNATKRDGGKP